MKASGSSSGLVEATSIRRDAGPVYDRSTERTDSSSDIALGTLARQASIVS